MPYYVGDLIEIWSNSNHKYAPGTILEIAHPGSAIMDRGHPVPIGSLKVEYRGGPNNYACKWVLPQDVDRMIRHNKAEEGGKGGKKGGGSTGSSGAARPQTAPSGPAGDGLKLCKMNCGRYVQPGLTRMLNSYDSCCKKCAKGRGQHDANCSGGAIAEAKVKIRGQEGQSWTGKELQRLLNQPDSLKEKTKYAIQTFGNGERDAEIRKENFKAFFEWLTYKSCSKPIDDGKMASLFSKYASGDGQGINMSNCGKLISAHLQATFNVLYSQKKLNLRRAMFVRKNPKPVTSIYLYGKKLGEGSFGTVYLVDHLVTKEKRVCKEIQKKNSSVPIEQILAEIKIMSELDHPNVLKVYEFFDTHDVLYMILEICAGGELLARIKKKGPKNEQVKIAWIHDTMKQSLRALSFMHSRRIAHKDLKPENILYTDDNSNTVKVIDFGLAEWFKQSQRYSDLQCGTPLYCAPEIFSNSPFDFRVDIWSLGIILFYMIEGALPFMGNNLPEVKGKVCSGDPPPVPRCNNLMQDLCVQMLTKNATARPTAPQCLTHKWFQAMSHQEKTLSAGIIQSLQNFNQQPELKKAVYFLVAHSCAMPQLEQIRELFTNLDETNDGTLHQATLREVLVKAGMSPHEAASIVHNMSRNANQLGAPIQYTEFISATISVRVSTHGANMLDYAFQNFDRSHKGSLTVEDFAVGFGEDAPDKRGSVDKTLQDAFNEIDADRTGKVDRHQFKQYMKKLAKMGMGNDYSTV
eukprot:GEMP01005881.1.p1 GENE.GEMP01005881.1~~GEMP01005881.1.p1  ORF type:complete len:747 (+),score=79.74 GEMP01005881.1:20-2260(+)